MSEQPEFLVYCTFDYSVPVYLGKKSVSVIVASHRHQDRGDTFGTALQKARLELFKRQARKESPHLSGLDIHAIELENFRSQDLQTLGYLPQLLEEYRQSAEKDTEIRKLKAENASLRSILGEIKKSWERSKDLE